MSLIFILIAHLVLIFFAFRKRRAVDKKDWKEFETIRPRVGSCNILINKVIDVRTGPSVYVGNPHGQVVSSQLLPFLHYQGQGCAHNSCAIRSHSPRAPGVPRPPIRRNIGRRTDTVISLSRIKINARFSPLSSSVLAPEYRCSAPHLKVDTSALVR